MKLDPVLRRFFEEASSLQLTNSEKSAMRRALEAHMALGVVHLTADELAEGKDALVSYMRAHPAQSPAHPRVFDVLHSFFFSRLPALTLSAVIVVAGSGAVVASAAESALPGDALYAVKVDILEPLRERMIRIPEKRMAWKVRKVERRLSEAKALQGRDRLTESHRAYIEQSIGREVEELQDDARWGDQEMVIASQQVLEETMDVASFEDDDIAEHREWRALKSFVRARRSEVHRSVRERMRTAYGNPDNAPVSAAPTFMAVPVSNENEKEPPVEAPVMMMRAKDVPSKEERKEGSERSQEKKKMKQKKEEDGESKAVLQEREDGRKENEAQPESSPEPEPLQDAAHQDLGGAPKQSHEEGMEHLKEKREHIEKELRGLRRSGELLH